MGCEEADASASLLGDGEKELLVVKVQGGEGPGERGQAGRAEIGLSVRRDTGRPLGGIGEAPRDMKI